MNKIEFLNGISRQLEGYPADEIQRSLDYYSEMIDDRIESGCSEDDAVAELGSVSDAAREIASSMPLREIVKKKVSKRRRLSALEIVLLVIGSPLWFAVLITLAAAVLSVYIAIWAVIIAVFAVTAAAGIGGIGAIIFGALFTSAAGIGTVLAYVGLGLVMAGIGILLYFASVRIARVMIKASGRFIRWVKSLISGSDSK